MTMLEQTLQQKAIYLVKMSLLMTILKQISTAILRIMMILSVLITSLQAREPMKLEFQVLTKERENPATSSRSLYR